MLLSGLLAAPGPPRARPRKRLQFALPPNQDENWQDGPQRTHVKELVELQAVSARNIDSDSGTQAVTSRLPLSKRID